MTLTPIAPTNENDEEPPVITLPAIENAIISSVTPPLSLALTFTFLTP